MNTKGQKRLIKLSAVVALVAMSGCVSSSKYKALEQENIQLNEENITLDMGAEILIEEVILQDDHIQQLQQEQEQLEEELTDLVVAGKIEMELLAEGLHLTLNEDVLFNSGEVEIKSEGKSVVSAIAQELIDFPYQIVVIGHSDNVVVGPKLVERFPSNWEVAGARAASVVRVLESEGLPSNHLVAASFSSSKPIASNDTPEGRAKNRRIEIRLRPVMPQTEKE